jgi:Undecaprenyl-phosphate glucose phosphotransferase
MTDIRSLPQSQALVFPRWRVPHGLVAPLGASLDIAVLMSASALAQTTYHGWTALSGYDVNAAIVASLVFLLIGKFRGLYAFRTLASPEHALPALLTASGLGAAAVIGLLFVLHDLADRSRGVELLFALYAMALTPLARLGLGRVIRAAQARERLGGRRAVLIGDAAEFDRLGRDDIMRFGFSEAARVGLAGGAQDDGLSEEDRARLALAIRLARGERAVEFALLVPWPQERRIGATLEALRASPLGVRLYPDASTRALLSRTQDARFDPFCGVQLRRPPLGALDRAAKRGFDLVLGATALVTLAPALLVMALLVRLTSPGPAIFKQTRRGFDGREFRIWKFRTMRVAEDGPALRQAQRDDARVTPVGRVLRRASLDELPQLINVLRGEMSLIGPRPHALAHDDAYGAEIREYALRRHVKPGLTGAAQAAGLRGETRTLAQMQARVAHDLWYIDNWSIWLDIRIAFQTLLALVRYEAY